MKYIDADKLKAEIDEKWKELADKNVKNGGSKYDIQISTYLSIKNLIESLQHEQPEMDLEKAAENSWTDYEYSDSFNLYSRCYKDGFRAGAQWREEHQKMIPFRVVPEDAWETSEGTAFAPRFKVVDNDGCENIPVHGISEELTLYYKEGEK